MEHHPMEQHREGTGGKAKKPILAVFVLLACALAIAACGGGSSSSSETSTETSPSGSETNKSSSESSTAAKGEPIVTMTYTDINTEGPTQKNLAETARVTGEWINAHGGIDGRPLEVHVCDAHGTTTGATQCAREAIADKAVATVGSFTFTGDAVLPILEQGHTAQFGNCCALTASEFTSENSFPIGTEPVYGAGMVAKAYEQGCRNMNAVIQEGAEAFEPLMEEAAESVGTKINKFVSLPAKPTDYSPQVAEATSGGAECLIMAVAETNFAAWMPAFAQSGSEATMVGPQGNFSEAVVKGFEQTVEGDIVAGSFPTISLPQWKDYREALSDYHADPELEYNGLGGLGTWTAYQAFKQVVEGMKGPINNETFLEAAKTAKINLPGLLPPLNLARPWGKDGGPKEFFRLMNRCPAFSEFKDGKQVPLGNSFEDASEYSGGTKPMDCGEPYA